ncbi:MAG: Gfo/Idh/MocA family oxidoreductase [bacterium]|nr:Gfo/Idh/MocA family oxidoreductase [bacterium]
MSLRVAVIGAGRAGRSRVAAIEAHPETELAGLVHRDPGAEGPTLERILHDDTVNALIVCTPNVLHPATARAALESGKHVAVEFPLAPGPVVASELFELARLRDRVLHVEHIELLSPSQLELREAASKLGRLHAGEVHFSAEADGWIGDPALAGSASLRAVARLHRIVDLFGPASVRACSLLRGSAGGYSLQADLDFEQGGELTLIEERGPGLKRATDWAVRCEHGQLESPSPGPAGALLAADLDVFVQRIRGAGESYVSEERILHVLGLVEELEGACHS